MTHQERHVLAHTALKLETRVKLDLKLQGGAKLNGDEVDAREGSALDIDEMAMVADVLRKACYLDVRGKGIDESYADEKRVEDREWKAVADYQGMLQRDARGAPKAPEAARRLWQARSRNHNLAVELVDYFMDALKLKQTAAQRKASEVLGRDWKNIGSQYNKAKRKRRSEVSSI